MTLKKLRVADLRLGMFLHDLDGPWLKNPFWKSRFLLLEADDLRAAQGSGIAECWIDTARGNDVISPPAPDQAREPVIAPADAAPAPPARAPFDLELQRAAALCRSARGATESMFNEARLGNAIDVDTCVPLVNEIAESVGRNPEAFITLARMKSSDDYIYMHSVAVCALMVALAQSLGMDEEACRDAGLAGLLHDLGKAEMPLEILNKPGKLTDAEFATMRRHPERGHRILQNGGGASAGVLDVCLLHHEKIDGSGYPQRLAGDAIPLLARMGAVCDVYDAITSNRAYKAGWDPAESVARMISWKGHFDHRVLSAFIKVLGIYPTGALVKMRSGKIGVVVEQNPASMTRPVVKLFYSTVAAAHIAVERVDLASQGPRAGDAIVGHEPRGQWDAAFIDQLWAGALAH